MAKYTSAVQCPGKGEHEAYGGKVVAGNVLVAIIAVGEILISADLALGGADFAYPGAIMPDETSCAVLLKMVEVYEDALRQIVEEHKNDQAVMLHQENTASLDYDGSSFPIREPVGLPRGRSSFHPEACVLTDMILSEEFI